MTFNLQCSRGIIGKDFVFHSVQGESLVLCVDFDTCMFLS